MSYYSPISLSLSNFVHAVYAQVPSIENIERMGERVASTLTCWLVEEVKSTADTTQQEVQAVKEKINLALLKVCGAMELKVHEEQKGQPKQPFCSAVATALETVRTGLKDLYFPKEQTDSSKNCTLQSPPTFFSRLKLAYSNFWTDSQSDPKVSNEDCQFWLLQSASADITEALEKINELDNSKNQSFFSYIKAFLEQLIEVVNVFVLLNGESDTARCRKELDVLKKRVSNLQKFWEDSNNALQKLQAGEVEQTEKEQAKYHRVINEAFCSVVSQGNHKTIINALLA